MSLPPDLTPYVVEKGSITVDGVSLTVVDVSASPDPVTDIAMLSEVAKGRVVAMGPVNDVAEVLADPHVRARKLVGSFDYPGVGEFKALALPYKFLGWDDPQIGPPPALGEHTEAILKERLGYSDARIDELRKAKAI